MRLSMGAVRISPQVEQEIESKVRDLGNRGEDARIDFLLDVQRMLREGADGKRATHMSDYLGVFPGVQGGTGTTSTGAGGARPPAKSKKRTRGGGRLDDAPVTVAMSLCAPQPEAVEEEFACPGCGSECCMDHATSDMVCTNCGMCTFVFGNSADNVTYEQHQSMNRAPGQAYMRGNHLKELLAQIQGRETRHIPQKVLDGVRAELRKMRITDLTTVDFGQIDEILHRLNFTTFYDHAITITSLVTGKHVTAISSDMEAEIENMFMQIQRPWLRHKPDDRVNFICYRYCLFQLFRILGAEEFLPRLRLLKSRARLAELDAIWKAICRDLNWTFYSVV